MKKISILAAVVLAAIMASCGGSTPKADLKNEMDSLSYAVGITQSQGLKEYLVQRMGVDTAYIDDFIKGLETIADNPDYIGQVYHYVQSIRRKVTPEDDIKEYKDKAIFDGLLEKMEEKIQQQRLQYKEQTEFMCQDIEKELCVKINRQINNLIKCMVLSTNEEKQYLISQINYPGVKTVKHLTEMMGVIEKGKMNAAPESIAEYTKLFDLVRSNLGEVLDKIADENPVQDKLALFMATKDLLTNFLGKKEEEKKEETPSESENK